MDKRVWISLILLLSIGMLNFADQGALFPNYSLIREEFSITYAQTGLISSSYVITLAGSMIIFGYLADKYSRKKLILVGATVWSFCALGTYFSQTYHQLLIVRIVGGVGIGSFFPIAIPLVSDFAPPDKRGRFLGLVTLIIGVGAGLGAGAAGLFGESLGWRFVFKYMGIIGLITVSLSWLFLREPERGESDPEIGDLASKVGYIYQIDWESFKRVWKKKSNIFFILQSFPGTVSWGIITTWIITYFHEEVGMAIPFATIFYGAWALGNGVGNIVGGYTGDILEKNYRTGRISLIIFGVLGGMVAMIYVIFMDLQPITMEFTGLASVGNFIVYLFQNPSYRIATIVFIMGGVLANFSYPNMYTMVENINVPEVRGTLTALNQSTDQLGRGLGPVLGGTLVMLLGSHRLALLVGALSWIPCALLFVPTYITKPKDEDQLKRELTEKKKDLEKIAEAREQKS